MGYYLLSKTHALLFFVALNDCILQLQEEANMPLIEWLCKQVVSKQIMKFFTVISSLIHSYVKYLACLNNVAGDKTICIKVS